MSVYQESQGSPILKGVIVVLFGVLIYVLYQPYKIREEQEMWKKESRARLVDIRAGQLMYIGQYGKYATSIDSLVAYIRQKTDEGTVPEGTFKPLSTSPFVPESLLHAPESGRLYDMTAVDTTVIKKYMVSDPDGYGSIGSLTDDARVNKASWED
jgi:hypothetical protein